MISIAGACAREHNIAMTPRQAFWQAIATVALPSAVFWGIVFLYELNARTASESWVLLLVVCVILFALPLPLAIPIYHRYRKDVQRVSTVKSPRHHVFLAALFAVLSAGYAMDLLHARDRWQLLFKITLCVTMLLGCVMQIRYAIQAIKLLGSSSADPAEPSKAKTTSSGG
jgi:hypothetical protein